MRPDNGPQRLSISGRTKSFAIRFPRKLQSRSRRRRTARDRSRSAFFARRVPMKLYSVDLSSYRSALRWRGTPDNKLTSRTGGQDRTIPSRLDDRPRPTTETDHVQGGERRFLPSAAHRPAAGNGERHQDLGDEAAEMDRRSAARQIRATSAFDCTASFGIRLCRFRRHGIQRLLGCGGCQLRIHSHHARKIGDRRFHLGLCGRARHAADGAFIRGHRKSLEAKPFQLSPELSILRHPQRLGLPCERLCRHPMGHLASSLLEPAERRAVPLERHIGQRQIRE